ncbi:hypothetical protein [Methanobrevibacter filiformis]|uniref:Uncharacterized protein n=1 Tax=Methanobrevibacter filiformis TaxID=55758 RepID=A0A166FAV6_9EURY|nr:hypothetical protein [Methanobrevibacter filiformis]KZX17480.1 hypothetical protein MBFIL_01380 [Methanobrevibacter filiformis]
MSDRGQYIINNLRSNQTIQRPDNPMHQLLDFGLGSYLDHIVEIIETINTKIISISNNIPDDDTTEWEEKITAGLLKLEGDQIGVYRDEDESNNDYRNRLLVSIEGNSSLRSIMNMIATLLNIPLDSFTVATTSEHTDYLEFDDTITNMLDNTTTDVLVSLITAKDPRPTITITLPEESNIQLVYDVISNKLFAGIILIVTDGTNTIPNE